MEKYEIDPPDGGYGWVVLGVVSFMYFCAMGGISMTGIFLVEFQETFSVSTTTVSVIGSIKTGLVMFGAPLIAFVVRKVGFRVVVMFGGLILVIGYVSSSVAQNIGSLFFTFGFLLGLGGACIYIASDITIQKYFVKKRSLANGIAVTASGIGVFTWPLLARWIIDYYGWNGACLILGGFALHVFPAAFLLRPVPMKRVDVISMDSQKNYDSINSPATFPTKTKMTDSLLPQKAEDTSFLSDAFLFFRIFVAWFAIRSGDTLFLLHTPIRSEMLDFTKHEAAVLLAIYGISSTIFSIPCGILGYKTVMSETFVVSLGATLCGLSMCVSLAYNTFAEMTMNSILFGIGTAAYNAMASASAVEILGEERIEHGIAVLFSGYGFGNIVSPIISGYSYEEYGTVWPVLTFGLLQIFGGFVILSTVVQKILPSCDSLRLSRLWKKIKPDKT